MDIETTGESEQALTSNKFIYTEQVVFHFIISQETAFHPESRTKEIHTQLSA